jgi:hypothetical protein
MKHNPKKCAYCEEEFIPARRNRKFCSDTCKQYNYLTKKTGKRYGVDKVQLFEKANETTKPLIITEQMAAVSTTEPSPENNPVRIAVTYEFAGKSVQRHPPNNAEMRKWYSTITG